MSATPIADLAFLSDRHSCALVDRTGTVEWLCFPRFDGPAVFAHLLSVPPHDHIRTQVRSQGNRTRLIRSPNGRCGVGTGVPAPV